MPTTEWEGEGRLEKSAKLQLLIKEQYIIIAKSPRVRDTMGTNESEEVIPNMYRLQDTIDYPSKRACLTALPRRENKKKFANAINNGNEKAKDRERFEKSAKLQLLIKERLMTIAKLPAVRVTMDINEDRERHERSAMCTNEPEEVKVNNKENDDGDGGDEPETILHTKTRRKLR